MFLAETTRLFIGDRDHLRPPGRDIMFGVQVVCNLLMTHLLCTCFVEEGDHSFQIFPVLALTASSLIRGRILLFDAGIVCALIREFNTEDRMSAKRSMFLRLKPGVFLAF